MPFTFILPTNIRFGKIVITELNSILDDLNAEKIMIVTDPGIIKAGLLDKVTEHISIEKEVFIFDEIEANPKDTNVYKGAEFARVHEIDCVVALGGGSSIDAAKAMIVLAKQGGQARDYVTKEITSDVLDFIAIPTTAGTGSEVTFSSVITDTKEHFKFTIKSPFMAAKIALVDPELTYSLPSHISASTGIDALVHAIEGYTATCTEPIAEALGLYAIELISQNIVKAVNIPDNTEAKDNMMMASLIAGLSFSHSDVAGVHCMAEALGSLYDKPHGLCNSIILPHMMLENMDYCLDKYARIADILGVKENDLKTKVLKGIEVISDISKEIGLPDFKSLNINPKDFRKLAEMSYKNGSNSSNPKPMSIDDYEALFTRINNFKGEE